MQYLTLSPNQLTRFHALKTTQELQLHGPLAVGQQVPAHRHTSQALYVPTIGAAVCITEKHANDKLLGQGQEFNAVLVQTKELHGWLATTSDTVIEHCFASMCQSVLAV
jgi:hypothetical protein